MHCALAMASLRRNQVDNQACCMVEELDASSIGDLAKAVQQIFGDTWTNIIGTRYGEKLFMGKQWGHPIKKTEQLDAEGTIKKIMTTEYVQNALKGSKR